MRARAGWILLPLYAALCVPALAQGLIEELEGFAGLTGTTWVGRFTSEPAPPFDHVIQWEKILSGQAVRWSKRVDAVGFAMETVFYWDGERDAVAFLQLASNGVHGEGIVVFEEAVISLEGQALQPGGRVAFRQTFEILPDGHLEDRYYRRIGDRWAPEHVIVYERCCE